MEIDKKSWFILLGDAIIRWKVDILVWFEVVVREFWLLLVAEGCFSWRGRRFWSKEAKGNLLFLRIGSSAGRV